MPGTRASFGSSAAAKRRLASWLRPTTWTSIGAGSPKLRIWLTMSAGMNENWTPGNSLTRRMPQVVHVVRGRAVILRQRHHDVGVAGADRRRVAVGQVEAAVGQADVVDDPAHLVVRHHLADHPFDAVAQDRRLLDAGAGRGAHVQLELAAVDRRERSPDRPTGSSANDATQASRNTAANRPRRPTQAASTAR